MRTITKQSSWGPAVGEEFNFLFFDTTTNDPIYIEDLAISGQDLIDNGIAEGKKVGELLFMLTDVVHRKPHENTKEALLGYARKYSRNKFAAAIRNVGLLNKK